MIDASEARKLSDGNIKRWRIKIESAIKSGIESNTRVAFVDGIPGQFYDFLLKELEARKYTIDEIRNVVPDNVVPLHLMLNESIVSLLIWW